jgi:hypothetical protein
MNKLSVATDQGMSCEVRMIVEVFLHVFLQFGAKGIEVGLTPVHQLQHVLLSRSTIEPKTSPEGLQSEMDIPILLQGKTDVTIVAMRHTFASASHCPDMSGIAQMGMPYANKNDLDGEHLWLGGRF